MVAQANFPHKELQHKGSAAIKKMLLEKGIDWENDFSIDKQRGTCFYKVMGTRYARTYWDDDTNIPIFKKEGRNFIDQFVYVGE